MATMHVDCFNTYMQKCPVLEIQSGSLDEFMQKCTVASNIKLERLTFQTPWKEPWRRFPSLRRRPMQPDTMRALPLVAKLCNCLKILSLPVEIAEMIRVLSDSAIFWRYALVFELAHNWTAINTEETEETDEPVAYPVSRIQSWERGCRPTLTPEPGNDPVISIEIDSRGINRIERLPQRRLEGSDRSDKNGYIVETATALGESTFIFRVRFIQAKF